MANGRWDDTLTRDLLSETKYGERSYYFMRTKNKTEIPKGFFYFL